MATYNREWIGRYLQHQLTVRERLEFEAAMRQDESLAAEVLQCRLTMPAFEHPLPAPARGHYKETRSFPKSYDQATNDGPAKKYLRAVLLIAVLIVVVFISWPKGSFVQQYGAIKMNAGAQQGESTFNRIMQQAALFFNSNQFDKALPLLNQALAADSMYETALFYRGVSRLHLNQLAAARNDLEKLYADHSAWKNEAAFYTAQSYAQQENYITAKEWLRKIPDSAAISKRSAHLLKKLK